MILAILGLEKMLKCSEKLNEGGGVLDGDIFNFLWGALINIELS